MKTAIGGSLVSALAIGGIVAAGVVADPAAPPARAATGLSTFEDCTALQKWYVEHTLDQVGPYGWGGGMRTLYRGGGPVPAQADGLASGSASDSSDSSGGREVANGETGTNTQEVGVDEPDVAKTDGRLVVRLVDGRRVVITDVSGSSPREVADWRIPDEGYVDGLLLVGRHVLLAGGTPLAVDQDFERDPEPEPNQTQEPGMVERRMAPPASGTRLIDLDISDPAHPRVDSRTSWSGRQLSLRQYGDTVRLVTSTGLPPLPFVQPRPGRLSRTQAEQRNREIVRDSEVEDWLPGFSSESGGSTGRLVGCDEVYHPRTWSGADTVAVATFTPGEVESATAVAVTGAGAEVYSSTDRLYVTATDWPQGRMIMERPQGPDSGSSSSVRPTSPRTHVHAFALDRTSTRYVASGSLEGAIRDRWSLDEHDGHLRVAVSWPDRLGSTRENGIVVLDERDGRLQQVGELRGLGPDEDIQSVRWFDDLAVVVTFRQMDPLYTVDLTDPTRPRKLGELKIPGFSSYLHPIGQDRLLGLGTDATLEGQSLGAQAGVFDVADPTRIQQLGKVTFGSDSQLGASEDPHAFTWLPDANAAITSLTRWSTGATEMVLLEVSPTGEVSTEQLPSPGGGPARALPIEGGRVALVGSTIRIIDLDD